MSKGKRNVAFGNDDDFDIEYVSKEPAQENKETQSNEIIIDSFDVRMTREEAIRGELNDFAKESPETVAAIIKSMFRGEI